MESTGQRGNWLFKLSPVRLYLFAAFLRILLLGFFGESWDIFVFIESTRQFVEDGLTPYQVALSKPPYIYMPYYPFTENWYAYPPLMLLIFSFFYLIAKTIGLTSPFFIRFFIKLPVSLSDLLLAFTISSILADFNVENEKRRYAELLILLNPFFVLVGTIWGMFDVFVSTLIILSLHFSIRERFYMSALLIALASLAKQTAFFVTPVLFAYWIKRRGFWRALLYAMLSASIFVAVTLPFYFSSPKGFLQQILLMHVGRPPWGYNVYTAIYFVIVFISTPFVTLNEELLITIIGILSSISFSLLILTIVFLSIRMYRYGDETKLIFYSLLTYLSFVFLNKVTNEPYFIYSLTLLLLYSFKNNDQKLIKLFTSFSYSLFIATLIAAVRFVIFIPSDILIFLFGHDTAEMLWSISPNYGESNPYVVATLFIAAIIVLPDLLALFKFYLEKIRPLVSGNLMDIIRIQKSSFDGKFYRFVVNLLRRISKFKFLTIFLTFLLLVPQITYLYSLSTTGNGETSFEAPTWPVIAVHYTWMSNPTHDPNVRDGDWIYSYLTPIEGFYESKQPYMEGDLEAIKDAGFSAILIDVYPGRGQKASLLATIALDYGLNEAPYIDLGKLFSLSYLSDMNPDLGNGTIIQNYYALKESTLSQILSAIFEGASLHNLPNALMYDGKFIIFIDGVNLVLPSFDREAVNYQIESMFYFFNISGFNSTALYSVLSKRWGVSINSLDDIYALYPSNLTEFVSGNDTISRDIRSIYLFSFKRFWQEIIINARRLDVNATFIAAIGEDPLGIIDGDIYLNIFDGVYYSRYEFRNLIASDLNGSDIMTTLNSFNSKTEFLSVFSYVENTTTGVKPYVNIYRETLKYAIKESENSKEMVIVFSWNDYINGFVIEPTKELGYSQLDITKQVIVHELRLSIQTLTPETLVLRRKKR